MLKKILKYTGIQLTGQLITIIVTIFSTSILYINLDIKEYGLISLLLGIFSMLSFMKGSLSSAFSKFFAKHEFSRQKLNEVLSSSILISISISILLFFIISFFLVKPILSFLNIPQELYSVAFDAFYFLIPFVLIQILLIPFRSYLNIKEDFYTITISEIIISLSKLLAAFLIIYDNSILVFFKFILVGQVLGAIFTLIRFNSIYKGFNFTTNLKLIYSIWNFSKWIFLGSGLYIIKEQGMGIVVNKLFGLTGNASFGVAKQIVNQLNSLVSKLKAAMNPLILKSWNSNNLFYSLAQNSAFSFLTVFFIILFITVFGDLILVNWISEIPNNFYSFFYLLSLIVLVKTLSIGFYSLFQGSGKIKNYEIFVNITGIIPVLLFFVFEINYFVFFILIIVFEFISFLIQILLAKKELNFESYSYLMNLIKNIIYPLKLINKPNNK
jgi:O-antigen/teichoic acid export membrane protein